MGLLKIKIKLQRSISMAYKKNPDGINLNFVKLSKSIIDSFSSK
jgi:hypothetical protein